MPLSTTTVCIWLNFSWHLSLISLAWKKCYFGMTFETPSSKQNLQKLLRKAILLNPAEVACRIAYIDSLWVKECKYHSNAVPNFPSSRSAEPLSFDILHDTFLNDISKIQRDVNLQNHLSIAINAIFTYFNTSMFALSGMPHPWKILPGFLFPGPKY